VNPTAKAHTSRLNNIDAGHTRRYLPTQVEAGKPSDWRKSKHGHSGRFEYLLYSELWTDVTFIVGTKPEKLELNAHKLILRTGSKVFDDLFNENEDRTSFEIPDVEPPEFRLLLKVEVGARNEFLNTLYSFVPNTSY